METDAPDHYATLGLDRRCTTAQIRSAFRLLAKRHHPDVNGGSAESIARCQVLNAAYETLSDTARRRAYDRELEENEASARQPRAAKIERNVSQDVHLRLDDFLRGVSLDVRVNDPGNPDGPEIYQLVIPPETAPGKRFRLARTAPFAGGFVQLRTRALPHFRFKLKGSDLQCDLRINSRRAVQGGRELVTGISGSQLPVQILAGVARGEVLRIPGEGMPKPRGGRGDLLIRIKYQPEVRIQRSR